MCPADATVCGKPGALGLEGQDKGRERCDRVRGPDTVGPWDFVFYTKL